MNLCASYKLGTVEREILEKGLTFIPTPTLFNKLQLRKDLYEYHRRLKILEHFSYNLDYSHQPFINPSTWEPESNTTSEFIQNLITKDLAAFRALKIPGKKQNQHRSNITSEQRRALKSLIQLDHVVIKPADKGGQIVLQDRTNYLIEANRQLQDEKYYVPLAQPMQPETHQLIQDIINTLYSKNFITFKQLTYLYGSEKPRQRLFYLLPKIHKAPESWTVPFKIPTGRPIVSDCGSESYRVAEYIDYYINPLAQLHPSYIKDTYDFVKKLSRLIVPGSTFLFSIDVDSLYTNIDTERGLAAVREAFQRFPREDRPDEEILQLLKITLTRNDFEFNNKHYLQISGCAMGRKYSPAYADIYMAEWERSAFAKCTTLPIVYLRYLDDIFGLWADTEESFVEFVSVLNSHHPQIKLKCNLQKTKVEFLDTEVFFAPVWHRDCKKLATKVYFKTTDRHALLHKTSYHPKHTYEGLIKSQLIRFHRICTYRDDVEEATNILFEALTHRGYSKRFLRKIKVDVNATFQNHDEYRRRGGESLPLIPMVETFSQHLGKFNATLKSNFKGTQQACQPLNNFKTIIAYRRNKNLKDLLVHTTLDKKKGQQDSRLLNYVPFIFSGDSGLGQPIKQIYAPSTSNIIYAIQCQHCMLLYIGETGRPLKVRMYEHLNQIRKSSRETTLYAHFTEHGIHNFKYIGLDSNPLWSTNQRKRLEHIMIQKLSTITPKGLNEKP